MQFEVPTCLEDKSTINMGSVNTGDQVVIKLDEGDEVHTFGYIVELGSLQFSDDSNAGWIQAMPLGTWMHPIHGAIVISKDRVKAFADNINNKVRGQDLDIDYDHKALTTEAAGWVREAKVVTTGEPKQRGLWLLVDWTEKAAEQIRTKAYRYFSPEYVDKWKHPQTGEVIKDVLFGGAITNRPFLKGILPLNLSELVQANDHDLGDNEMDRKVLETLASNLKLEYTADTSDADLLQAVTEATAKPADDSGGSNEGDGDTQNQEQQEGEPVLANEADLKKLAESNPAIAILLAERAQTQKRLAELETANKLAEVTVQLNEIDNNGVRLTPAAKTALSEILVNVPSAIGTKVMNVAKMFAEGKGTVQLGEIAGKPPMQFADAGAEFDQLVRKLQEGQQGLSFSDAVVQASMQNPDLYEAYRASSYAFKED